MKVLLITMEYPPFRGGVGNYYYNLVQSMNGVEVKILVNRKDTRYKIQEKLK